jgi:integrase
LNKYNSCNRSNNNTKTKIKS